MYILLSGMVAICAMVLPGISGSTLLLIFGLYIPIINGIKEFLHMNFTYFPALFIFGVGVGVVAGILCAPKKGSEMVKEIKDTSKKAYDKSKNLTKDDVIEAINTTSDKLKKAVEEFDYDKAKESTKDKVSEVKTNLDELVQKAKDNESCQEVLERIDELSKKAMDKINEYKDKIVEYGQDLYDDIEDEFDEELDDVNKEIDDLLDEIEEDEESKED